MLATFLITFREGLEAFLLVGILLTYLNRLNVQKMARWIWVGVLTGILASIIVAFVFQVLVDQLHNERYRAMMTIAIMLTAVCILSYMALWMQRQARNHAETAQRQLAEHVSKGKVLGIASLAFVSVLREGIETVLFLSALAYGGQQVSPLWGILGLLASGLVVWTLLRTTRRVPLRQFFQGSSLLLIIIAAGLLSSVINQLQALRVNLGPTTPIFDLSAILSDTTGVGIFMRGLFGYNATPTLAQFGGWLIFLIVAISVWYRNGKTQS